MSDSRFMFRAILALAGMLLVTIALLVVVWTKADGANSALKANVQNQVSNRTANVAHWCTAIDQLDRTLTAYVGSFRNVPALHLTPLNCAALEANTLASTHSH